MIQRFIENKVEKSLRHFPVVAIIGPRQVGKTTLAKSIAKMVNRETIYIDLENPRDFSKLQDPVLYFEANQDKCIILDEIQRNSELFPVLRSMIDMNRVAGRFILLGSASPALIRDSSESLAGRIAYIELTPFNLTELTAKNNTNKLWLQGGFPDAFLLNDSEMLTDWHYNYLKTYIERDLPNLGLKVSGSVLMKLLQMLSHVHGDMMNYSGFSKSLGLDIKTIKKYIDFFEEAFLIEQLKPFHTNIKKRLVKAPKVYIRDSGVLHYLQNISDAEDLFGSPLLGNSWEGFVIEQIRQLLPRKYETYYYRTQDGTECDLVITKSQKPIISIEIKYTSAPKITRGMTISFNDLGTDKNYIITPNGDDFLLREDVRVCNLFDFLTKYLPK
ncbi:MAG: putative AAA+ superfamily ATPase [Salibacteraceae bacterium]|jgi:predicted AAA+ superfamily ATPase